MEARNSADGWTLDGDSGSYPECHRGENVLLIHPDDKAFKELAKTVSTRSPKWYEPIA